MRKFFLGVLTGVAGTVAVTAIGKNLYRKMTDFLLDALDPDKPGNIPDAGPDSIPREEKS